MQARELSETPPGTVKLLALFEDDQAKRRAVHALERENVPIEQLHVLPQPRSHPLFAGRIVRWGVSGAIAGALMGGSLAWALGGLLQLERGLLLQEGLLGEALSGAVMGALLVGMLGLVAGLALGESEGVKAVSQRSPSRQPDGASMAASKTLLRINIPSDREGETRRLLETLGAASVEEESHSPWWDQAA